MRQKQVALAAGMLLLAAAPLYAQDEVDTIPVQTEAADSADAASIPFTYVSGQYLYTDYDDTDVGQHGFGVEGSFELIDSVFVVGSVFYAETEEFDDPFSGESTKLEQTLIDFGAGYHHGLTPTVEVYADLRALFADVEVFGVSDDDTGFLIDAGLRALVLPEVELGAEVTYFDVFDDDETDVKLSALYSFTPKLGAGVDVVIGDQENSYGATLRYAF